MNSIPRFILCLLFLGFVSSAFAYESDSKRQPNVVMILVDDLGYETIGANGGVSYKTPVLDDLARTAVRFEHCYAQPLCTPTRVKLMTGQSNVRNYVRFGKLETSQKTFGNLFHDNGYKTCVVGKWQLGPEKQLPAHFGFEEHCLWQLDVREERFPNPTITENGETKRFKNGEYGPDVCANYAIEFIKRNKDKPFLLYYPMILTHCPFCPTPDSQDWDPKNKGSATYKGDPKYFGDMVTYMDKIIGRILKTLDESEIRENTLVMIVGDNGTDTPVESKMKNGDIIAGAKNKTIDGGTHVPLLVDWKGMAKPGHVVRDLVDMSDFLPTMLEATGVKPYDGMILDGQSFLPQVKGEKGSPREAIYIWYCRNPQGKGKNSTPKVFARDQRYKLYRSGDLFDVANDPKEKSPLAAALITGKIATTKTKLQNAIDRFSKLRLTSIPEAERGKLK